MKYIIINDQKFELIENVKDAYDFKEVSDKLTDYFDEYDYILGDWAYGKLRLKGFCKKENPKFNNINNFENKENYIKNECAYGCKYFVIERIK
jgi:uncharacterized protein YutD